MNTEGQSYQVEPLPVSVAADACGQIMVLEGRRCEQPAEFYDEESGEAYCEAHTAALRAWRADALAELADDRQRRDEEQP